MTIYSDVGKKIKSIRTSKKITQESFAEMINMDVRSVTSIENGRRNPTLKTIHKMCKSLGVSSSEVLSF